MISKRCWSFLVVGAGAAMLAACTTTQEAKVAQADIKCGFIGPVCSQLKTGAPGQQIAWLYTNPAVDWTKYKKLMIQPVTYWDDEKSKVSVEEQNADETLFDVVRVDDGGGAAYGAARSLRE